ncbi:MAG: phosphoribosylglycinamide formyltransferase [Ferroplasma sp.]
MKKIVVMASGNGTNFQAIIDSIDNGEIYGAQITQLICNNKRANAIERAKANNIKSVLVDKNDKDYNSIIMALLSAEEPDLIVLDGYMKILPDYIIDRFPFKIINLHPSLLPAFGGKGFYGKKVHEAVINSGARFSGCTVHFATVKVDNGPIIEQRIVAVEDNDTPESLEEKVHEQEHIALIFSINLVLSGKYSIYGNRTVRE